MTTMHEEYEDESEDHEVCENCELCKKCGDCTCDKMTPEEWEEKKCN